MLTLGRRVRLDDGITYQTGRIVARDFTDGDLSYQVRWEDGSEEWVSPDCIEAL